MYIQADFVYPKCSNCIHSIAGGGLVSGPVLHSPMLQATPCYIMHEGAPGRFEKNKEKKVSGLVEVIFKVFCQ